MKKLAIIFERLNRYSRLFLSSNSFFYQLVDNRFMAISRVFVPSDDSTRDLHKNYLRTFASQLKQKRKIRKESKKLRKYLTS